MQKMKKTIEGSGSDLFICFTSRPSASSASAAATMRVPSSKSLMSPNRSGGSNPSIPSLSSSLSRRLRNSGSIKGGQSPMFPAAGAAVGRKKGVAFEAAEPSSPKVTCIGQVRVKSKKKKKSKNTVARTGSGREASFRRSEAAGGRKAVSICDALRAFGSEMNCFVPCGWSLCSSGEQEQEQRKRKKRSSSSSSCGAAFARWLMAIEEEGEEAEKGRELVGLVVEERRGKGEVGVFVREKEVELEVEEFFERRKEGIFERKGEVVVLEKEVEEEEEVEAEEEKGRVSVCIPPRNALLLMRCRSDPVRMAALANRFCDSPAMKVQCEEGEEEDEGEEEEVGNEEKEKVVESKEKDEAEEGGEVGVEQVSLDAEEVEKGVILDEQKGEALEEEKLIVAEEDTEKVEKEVNELDGHEGEEEEEILGEVISAEEEAASEEEKVEGTKATDDELIEKEVKEEETLCVQRGREDEGEELEIILRRSISCSAAKSNELAKAKEGAKRRSFSYREKKEKRRHSFSMEREARRHSFCSEKEARRSSFSVDKDGRRRWSFSIDKENLGPKEKPIVVQSAKQTTKEEVPAAKEKTVEAIEPKITEKTQAAAAAGADEVREKIQVSKRDETQVVFEKEKKSRGLPDCLLLMMYEPKLSMEVSKETWVCSTDFRWRPNYSHPANQPSEAKAKADDGSEDKDKCTENKNVIAAVTTANAAIVHPPPSKPPPTVSAIEQKLLKSSAIGPFPPLPQPPYEHFVLTRCKSEPLKSSARLAPDACFWKSRHQPIGTAGLGF